MAARGVLASNGCDVGGAGLSALCLAHCACMPLAIALLPAAAARSGAVHQLLAVATAAVALGAFVPGFARHRRGLVLGLGGVGVAGVLAGAWGAESVMGDRLAGAGLQAGVLTVTGGVLLIAGHFANWAFGRSRARGRRGVASGPGLSARPAESKLATARASRAA